MAQTRSVDRCVRSPRDGYSTTRASPERWLPRAPYLAFRRTRTPHTVAWTDPDEHQFFVPERVRWSAIRGQATNIGETLNKACAALEEQNGAL